MSTPKVIGNNVCVLCRVKPRFGNHIYCGKNCAQQAASLCDHCHQKPKFGGHNYCSKYCAAQSQPAQARAPYGGNGQGKGARGNNSGGKKQPARSQTSPGFLAGSGQQILTAAATMLPQLTKGTKFAQAGQVIGAALPHVQVLLQPQAAGASGVKGHGVGAAMPVPQVIPQVVPIGTDGQNLPSAYVIAAQPLGNTTNIPSGTTNRNCRVPGCNQPAHVDPNGAFVSDYCSQLHREEAVQLGVADACIMCLKLPQSGDDHFCSRACRDQALSVPA